MAILLSYSPDARQIKVDNIFQYFSVKMAQVTNTVLSYVTPEYPDGVKRVIEYKKLQFC